MNQKLWGSLSLDEIANAKAKAPNKFKNNDKYGNQMTFDARQWDDGGISLSVSYKDEAEQWQRINIGRIMVSKDQGQPAQQQQSTNSGGADLPF